MSKSEGQKKISNIQHDANHILSLRLTDVGSKFMPSLSNPSGRIYLSEDGIYFQPNAFFRVIAHRQSWKIDMKEITSCTVFACPFWVFVFFRFWMPGIRIEASGNRLKILVPRPGLIERLVAAIHAEMEKR